MLTLLIISHELDVCLDEVLYLVHESFAPLIARSLQGSGLMSVRSSVGLVCRLAVTAMVEGRMLIVFDLRRVVLIVSYYCMMEDMFDHCFS